MDNDVSGTTAGGVLDRSSVMDSVTILKGKSRISKILSWVMACLATGMVYGGWMLYYNAIAFQAKYPTPDDSSFVKELVAMVLITVGLVLTLVWCWWISTQGKKINRAKLSKSDLAVRLAGGTFEQEKLLEYVPWYLHFWLKKAKSTSLGEVLDHVSTHLNWYLNEPKRYFPGSEYLVFIPYMLFLFLGPNLWLVGQSLMVVCFLPTLLNSSWQSVNYLEFANYLRELIEA